MSSTDERMKYTNMMVTGTVIVVLISFFVLFVIAIFGRDKRGFNRKGIHKNGTRFDDFGYDFRGYDKNGYNRKGFDKNGYDKNGYNGNGFDKNGYDVSGFNKDGYKIDGRNINGKYNRLYDKQNYIKDRYNREGFLNPKIHPVTLSNHARERIYERYPNGKNVDAGKLVREAYAYGKSSFQVTRTLSADLKEIETRHENGTALLYNGYVFIFSEKNVLITMYKKEKVIL